MTLMPVPGDVLAHRFVLERLAGSGGMGHVYRALDRDTGAAVALKVLGVTSGDEADRFRREAAVLATLSHPAIVRYVAHGTTAAGDPFLAMEWLEGHDLGVALRGGGMAAAGAVSMFARIAAALGVAHQKGVVHRDLKPGNIFLEGGRPDRAKLIDFGIALKGGDRQLTLTGAVIGTPQYMSPEQARGARSIGPPADVWSLGCVLFECLTGLRPFQGDNPLAILAKILFDDAPRLSQLRSDVPAPLADLCEAMLAKDPAARPADGAAVAARIEGLGDIPSLGPAGPGAADTPPTGLTAVEQRIVCVVIASAAPGVDVSAPTDVHTAPSTAPLPSGTAPVWDALARLGGRVESLLDGSLVVTVTGAEAPTDLAARAARSALLLSASMPGRAIAVATGRAVVSARLPVGDVIDRGARALTAAAPGVIAIDSTTAGLLGARFEVRGDADGLRLTGEREIDEAPRRVLGKATAFVGRQRERGTLMASFEECLGEPVARAVLVTGPAGSGKSRLCQEILRRLRAEAPPGRAPAEVVFARGDPLGAGSPFGLLGPAIRRAAGISDGEPFAVRRSKLAARVGRHVPESEVPRVAAFLGELCGVPLDEDDYPPLRSARRDAMLCGDAMQLALVDWLRAECAAQPVLLVVEDLQHGDLPSVAYTDAALRALRDAPFFVLGFARPEVHTTFPELWIDREVQEVRLGALTPSACRTLVKEVLEDGATEDLIRLILERAEGNPFYLEELVRAVATGARDALPESLVGMVQARLEALGPEARRVLRAASVFGPTFWRGGVVALVQDAAVVDTWLDELMRREVVVRSAVSGVQSDPEYAFESALVRDAAYAALTDEDRRLGHRLAGEWLERVGHSDPVMLAEHFERGGDATRAAVWCQSGARLALAGNDFGTAIARAARGVALGASGEALGRLLLVQAEAHRWRGEPASAEERAVSAEAVLSAGSGAWFDALAEIVAATSLGGRYDTAEARAAQAVEHAAAPGAEAAKAACMCRAGYYLAFGGRYGAVDALVREAQALLGPDADSAAVAALHRVRAMRAQSVGDSEAFLRETEAALRAYDRAGDARNGCALRDSLGYAWAELGDLTRAARSLAQALGTAERMGLAPVAAMARHNLGRVLARLGHVTEGRAVEEAALNAFIAQGDRRLEGGARVYLAEIHFLAGDFQRAELEARRAADILEEAMPPARMLASAWLARALLASGRVTEAVATLADAAALFERLGGIKEGAATLREVIADALAAAGDAPERPLLERTLARLNAPRTR